MNVIFSSSTRFILIWLYPKHVHMESTIWFIWDRGKLSSWTWFMEIYIIYAHSLLLFDFFTNTTLDNHIGYCFSCIKPTVRSLSTSFAMATFLSLLNILCLCFIFLLSGLLQRLCWTTMVLIPSISSWFHASACSTRKFLRFPLVDGIICVPILLVISGLLDFNPINSNGSFAFPHYKFSLSLGSISRFRFIGGGWGMAHVLFFQVVHVNQIP